MTDTSRQSPHPNVGTELFGLRDERTEVPAGLGAAICAIEVYRTGDRRPRSIGTGWLASPTLVVTAAHVIHDDQSAGSERSGVDPLDPGGVAARVVLSFDRAGGTTVLREASTDDIHVHHAYRLVVAGGVDEDRDLALIRLRKPLERSIEPLRFGATTDAALAKRSVRIAGVKLDEERDEPILVEHRGPIVEVGARYLLCRVQADKAQSGAPVSLMHEDGEQLVVALHARGLRGTADEVTAGNFAVRIDEEAEQWIRSHTARR